MPKMTVGFTCGSFDLLHAGHVMMLEEIKGQVDYLIVGLQTDPTLDRPDKNKPVQSLEERIVQLKAVRWVDEVVIYDTESRLVNELVMLKEHCDQNDKQLIRFLGADWEGKEFTGHDLDIEVRFNSRNHSYSSSELRKRIEQADQVNDAFQFRGEVMRDDERYLLQDNHSLDHLVLSKTTLKPGQGTRGHSHEGLDEVYHFVKGNGTIYLDGVAYKVSAGSLFTIRGGQHHRVQNASQVEALEFICVFEKYERT